ncbi:uncharacterized protein LOC143621371 [Bidens hawaiensis]|uniref:uncharacterized protein LOC143621371 n=1 Tax=Bidens hawaiensis TaxID=980011 RepID=UPI00404AB589
MGSSSSKSIEPESAATRRSFSRNVFQPSCIRPPSTGDVDDGDVDIDGQQVSNQLPKENGIIDNHSNMSSSKSRGRLHGNKHVKTKQADKRAHVPSEPQFGEWGESSLSGSVSRTGSGSSRNTSSRFLSHFSFFSGNLSSCSSRAYVESSTSSVISNDDNKSKIRQGCEIFPSCFMPASPGPHDDDSNSGSGSDNSELSSIHELDRDGNTNYGMESNRRMEPIEQNVRFSRTLSVGRLRDRVLNRPTFPELASETGSRSSNENVMMSTSSSSYSSSTVANSLYENRDLEVDYLDARETRYPNLLEHRANFLERRRRIRSQVHALQRMGSRFENLSGHERSCILSGQHRTGHCTCRLNNQDPNSARDSISRIVLLAEALSEVLEEIHQQSVISSSRNTLSSIGSVPAPNDIVEALPVKLYHKLSKHLNEEKAQCYICLVEYEDGDEVRVLPCHHEFHRLCIDKWLKEIHRICPLCRGDVCKTASLPAEGLQL